eukprot:gene10816-18260_t
MGLTSPHCSSLSVGVGWKRSVSLVPVNIRGYHRHTEESGSEFTEELHASYVECLLDVVDPAGLLDAVVGDRARATYNAARPCSTHHAAAADCALRLAGGR